MAVLSLLLLGGLWSAVGASDMAVVTCGSVVKLLNTRHNVRLHSHDVRYGSGTDGDQRWLGGLSRPGESRRGGASKAEGVVLES